MHKSQIFFYVVISFLLGVFVASVFNIGQSLIYLGFVVAIGLMGVFGYKRSFNKEGMLWGFMLASFLFGAIRFNSVNLNNSRLSYFTDLSAGQKGVEVVVKGYVDDEPKPNGTNQDLVLKVKELVAGDKKIYLNEKVLVRINSFPKFHYGDFVSVNGSLRKPQNFDNFDYVTYLKKEGVRTTMFYPKISTMDSQNDTMVYQSIGLFERARIGMYRRIFDLKNKFENSINQSVAEPNASFVNGILLGSRQGLSDSLKEAFNKTGTTHILAISGYNIMIISWVILWGFTHFFKRRTAFWCSVAIIVLFTILTGASSSVVRAAIMGLLLLSAQGYGRLYNPRNSIVLAGAVMVWVNPFALVFDIGFQLSFAAVIGLMYLYPQIESRLKVVPKLGGIKENILMTISAQVAVAPILIYYFKTFSFISVPANVLVVPFLPVAMLAGFVTGLVGMIFLSIGYIVGWFAWAVTSYQIEVIKLLSLL